MNAHIARMSALGLASRSLVSRAHVGAIRSQGRRVGVQQQRGFAAQAQGKKPTMYDVFMKTNSRYLMFVITGAAVGEFMFGFVGDMIWDLNNRGVRWFDL